jgi:hypothetical protein
MTIGKNKAVHKKRMGRPPGRSYAGAIPVRFTPKMLTAIDRWVANKDVSRSEAIRTLIERGLKK